MKLTAWFIVLSVVFIGLVAASDYTDCTNKLSVLERAVYETADNELQLNRAFFPPRQMTSRYVTIDYTFLKNSTSDVNCSVTYIWSIGGFLLIQPPQIFMFTSLLLSIPSNNIERITITLPYKCRPLVLNSSELCSCNNSKAVKDSNDNEITLDILSQQVG